jgi:GT2 family glycosyltransferase
MSKTFAIGIPTLNRFDMLKPSLMMTLADFPTTKIFVLDNGRQDIQSKIIRHPNLTILEQEKNLGVAGSWNLLCSEIFWEHDYALILNDDVYFGSKNQEVAKLLEEKKADFYVTTQDWCAFIMPKKTFTKVGAFDTKFYPAYYEDNDYHYRMKLLNMSYHQTPVLNPFLYQSSKTVEKEPSLRDFIQKNKEYYAQKWGGLPSKEKYKKPFNQK